MRIPGAAQRAAQRMLETATPLSALAPASGGLFASAPLSVSTPLRAPGDPVEHEQKRQHTTISNS